MQPYPIFLIGGARHWDGKARETFNESNLLLLLALQIGSEDPATGPVQGQKTASEEL